MKEKIRCFIAIDLPEACKRELISVQEQIKKTRLFEGKYTEPENIHLTLKFLGEIEAEKIMKVKERLKTVPFKPFGITITKFGVFSESFIRIVWAQAEGKELYKLQKQIDSILEPLFQKEERFMGHITIARVKQVKEKEKLLAVVQKIKMHQGEGSIKKFTLRKSTLTSEGPKYEDLAIYSAEKEKAI